MSDEGGDEFFKESTSQQPSLLQIMDVQAGVALKEGDGAKQGPQILENPKKMSRATYKMHQTMVSQPAGTQEQTGVGAESPETSKRMLGMQQKQTQT